MTSKEFLALARAAVGAEQAAVNAAKLWGANSRIACSAITVSENIRAAFLEAWAERANAPFHMDGAVLTLRTDDRGVQVVEATQDPSAMSFQEFSRENRARCEAPNGFAHDLGSWSHSDWLVAVTGELGEAANVQKKLNRVRDGIPGNKEDASTLRDRLADEIGDTYIYLDLYAQSLGLDIAECVRGAFDSKSAEIGYKP